jgi:muramidase (phage lysozyme)
MKRLHLPSGLQQGIAMIIQQDWSTEQAVAVVELLSDLQEVICRHYQPQIQEFMRQDRGAEPNASSAIHDDDVPF